ncbi:MAG: signal peptidase I [Candidatus Eiseniibacteriota bacterium]
MDAGVANVEPDAGGTGREPWLGANLSLCLPGLGQWYAGTYASAALQIGAALVLIVGGALFTFARGLNGAVGLILVLGLVPLWLFSAWTAHRDCRDRATAGFDELRRTQRDAWKAVFLSRFLPGLGQLYDRRVGIGLLFMVVAFVLVIPEGPLGSLLSGSLVAIACLDAWFRSRGRREGPRRALWGISAAVWVALCSPPLLAAYAKTYLVRAIRVASGSMAPVLEPDDRVFVDLRTPGRASIGDIVLLPFPNRPDQMFLKAAFALPGDLVEFRGDGAYRNGARVIDGRMDHAPVGFGRAGTPYRVPEGAIFVIGYNHANSNDSRFFGPIPIRDVKGRAYKIYWPPARARTL